MSANQSGLRRMMERAAGEVPEESPDYTFKIVVVGDSGCGKTNLLTRFVRNEFFPNSQTTIGVEFANKTIDIKGGRRACIQVWDTAGQDRYRAITSAYYRSASGAFLVYDMTRASTFKSLEKWLGELRQHLEPEIPIVVVGNKSDLRPIREVSQEQARRWCEQNCISMYLETSCLENINVEVAFLTLVNAIVDYVEKEDDTNDLSKNDLIPSDASSDKVYRLGPTGKSNSPEPVQPGWCYCGK